MLLNNLFFVDHVTVGDYSLEAVIRVDKHHAIFEGHFPGMPIVPGVCMIQLVKELLEKSHEKKFRIQSAPNIKFLAVIDPTVNEHVNASILIEQKNDTQLKITASLFAGEVTFFKLKAALISA